MPTWKERKTETINGVELIVKERWERRNRLGATEYIIVTRINGETIGSERHDWNVWEGHCGGRLLLPKIAERARAYHALSITKPPLESNP